MSLERIGWWPVVARRHGRRRSLARNLRPPVPPSRRRHPLSHLETARRRDDETTRRTTPTTGPTAKGLLPPRWVDDGWLLSPWMLPMMTTPTKGLAFGPGQPWPGRPPVTQQVPETCASRVASAPRRVRFSTWTLQESVRRLASARARPGTGTARKRKRQTAPSSTGSSAVDLVTTDLSPAGVCRVDGNVGKRCPPWRPPR